MATRKPFQAALKPTHRKGLVPGSTVDSPGGTPRSRGVPAHLLSPEVAIGGDSGKPVQGAGAASQVAASTIRAMVSEGQDAETAGSMGQGTAGTPPNAGNIPGPYRDAIVNPLAGRTPGSGPPGSINVP